MNSIVGPGCLKLLKLNDFIFFRKTTLRFISGFHRHQMSDILVLNIEKFKNWLFTWKRVGKYGIKFELN